MDTTLLPLREYCEQYKVTTAIGLEAAPRHIQMLLKVHWLRPQILKYLKWRQNQASPESNRGVRIYADKQELYEIERCHARCIEILQKMLSQIYSCQRFRAIDVAGGDGRLSIGLLLDEFEKVDLFDQCPQAVKKAKLAMKGHKGKGYIAQAGMQYFNWRYKYSGIFLVWCVGYLSDQELIVFLRRAKSQLITEEGVSPSPSFLY